MIKTIYFMFAVSVVGIGLGLYFRSWYVESAMREERNLRTIKEYDRHIEENTRLFMLINSNEPNWMEAWEDYIIEQSLLECGPV